MRKKDILAAGLMVALLAVTAWAKKKPAASDQGQRWVGTWASAPMLANDASMPPAPGFADSTLRQIVHVSIGGRQIRVRFSNAFGSTPLTIPAAHVAAVIRGSVIAPDTEKALSFSGQPAVTIPAGALAVSDALDFNLVVSQRLP